MEYLASLSAPGTECTSFHVTSPHIPSLLSLFLHALSQEEEHEGCYQLP